MLHLYYDYVISNLSNEGVTRSYVVEQAPPKVRTYMLARLSALQYAGFAATPLLGSSVSWHTVVDVRSCPY